MTYRVEFANYNNDVERTEDFSLFVDAVKAAASHTVETMGDATVFGPKGVAFASMRACGLNIAGSLNWECYYDCEYAARFGKLRII